MTLEQTAHLKRALRALIGTAILLAIIFLVPQSGHNDGRSFFQVAQSSTWGEFGEWLAAWCSLKIVLLGFCALVFIQMADSLWMVVRQDYFSAGTYLALLTVPVLIFCTGVFFLVKALL